MIYRRFDNGVNSDISGQECEVFCIREISEIMAPNYMVKVDFYETIKAAKENRDPSVTMHFPVIGDSKEEVADKVLSMDGQEVRGVELTFKNSEIVDDRASDSDASVKVEVK